MMLNKNFLILSMITTLLSAGTQDCPNGACFATFSKPNLSKVLDAPKYIEDRFQIQNEMIDKSITIVLDGKTITVFPKSTYVMSEEEKNDYYNKETLLRIGSIKKIEDNPLNQARLPSSEYFCEENKRPFYQANSTVYECI